MEQDASEASAALRSSITLVQDAPEVSAALHDSSTPPAIPREFQSQVDALPPVVRALLVDNADPAEASAEQVLDALGKLTPATRKAASLGDVLHRSHILSATSCATLRAAVDAERSLQADTVDSGPEHQLNLERESLERLLGKQEALRLWRLPLAYRRWRRGVDDNEADASEQILAIEEMVTEAEAEAEAATLQEAFIRRYSPETRPLLKFHADAYELTVNVALSADAAHGGGNLIGLFKGVVRALDRGEGDATVHSSSLLHAVSRMTTGVRYSLILFFDRHPGRYDPTRYEKRWIGGHAGSRTGGARWWED